MAATVEDLDFLAPGLADVSVEDKQRALDLAAAYRPACLPEDKQDLAQLYYAIYLLYLRVEQAPGNAIPWGVISEKEGDVQKTYGNSGVSRSGGFYDQWKSLWDLCGFGAITVNRRRRHGCC